MILLKKCMLKITRFITHKLSGPMALLQFLICVLMYRRTAASHNNTIYKRDRFW